MGQLISERPEGAAQGYRRFRAAIVASSSTNLTGSLNLTQHPLRCHRARRLLAAALEAEPTRSTGDFLPRGIEFTYEAVRDCEAKLTASLIDNLRRCRGADSRYAD